MHSSVWTMLRALRKDRGLTLEQIADRIGVGHSFLSRAERGLAGLHLETLEKYLAACGFHLEVIPDDDPDSIRISLAGVPDDRRDVARALVRLLPLLPDVLVDDLRDRARLWSARYGGPAE